MKHFHSANSSSVFFSRSQSDKQTRQSETLVHVSPLASLHVRATWSLNAVQSVTNSSCLSPDKRSQYIQSIMHEKGRGSHHAVGDKTVHWRITVHVRKKAKGAVKLKCWELQDYYSHTHMHTEQWRDASCASTPVGNIECLKVWSR